MTGKRFYGYLMTEDGEKEISLDADKETLLDAIEELQRQVEDSNKTLRSMYELRRITTKR